jgi:hypothetical protein
MAKWSLVTAPTNTRFFPNGKIVDCKKFIIMVLKHQARVTLPQTAHVLFASTVSQKIVSLTIAHVKNFVITQIACGLLADPFYPDGVYCDVANAVPSAWVRC